MRSASLLGLLILCCAFAWLDMSGFRLVSPLQEAGRLIVLLLVGLLLLLLIFAVRHWPVLIRPFRASLALILPVGMLLYGVWLMINVGQTATEVSAGSGISYVAVRRGGLGSQWTDIVERKVYFGLLLRDQELKQFQAESVAHLRLVNGFLQIELSQYQKNNRTVTLELAN